MLPGPPLPPHGERSAPDTVATPNWLPGRSLSGAQCRLPPPDPSCSPEEACLHGSRFIWIWLLLAQTSKPQIPPCPILLPPVISLLLTFVLPPATCSQAAVLPASMTVWSQEGTASPFLQVPKSPWERAALEKKERRNGCLSPTSLLTPCAHSPAPCAAVGGWGRSRPSYPLTVLFSELFKKQILYFGT